MQGKLATHDIQHEIVGFYADESAKHVCTGIKFNPLLRFSF